MITAQKIAVGVVAAQWLAVILIVIVKKTGNYRSAIGFVISDLTFLFVFSALFSAIWIPLLFLDPHNANAYLFPVIATPLLMVLGHYLPLSILPTDLLSRLVYGRPKMDCVSIGDETTGSESCFRVAHLTDLHLTQDLTVEADLSTRQVREIVLNSFRWSLKESDVTFVTGDITDQGRAAEWDDFLNVIASEKCSLGDGRILVVPGNHDLSLVAKHTPGAAAELSYDQHAFTFITKILANCPQHWMMWTEGGRVSVRSYLESVKDYLDCYAEHPPFTRSTPAGGSAVLEIWFPEELTKSASLYKSCMWPTIRNRMCSDFLRLAYPMVMLEDDRYVVIGLNSCDESPEMILNSGYGRLGNKQIARFQSLAKEVGSRCLIVLLHHHVGMPPQILTAMKEHYRRVEIRALALRDGYKFAKVLEGLNKCVVFHGHKHIGYQATLGSATVVSGPSVTYGSEFGGSNCAIYMIDRQGTIKARKGSPFTGRAGKGKPMSD